MSKAAKLRPMTPRERNHARDIRKAIKNHKEGRGPPVKREKLAWLRDYVDRVNRNRGGGIIERERELEAPPDPAPAPKPRREPPPAPPPSPPDDDDEDDDEDDDDDDDESGEHERPEPQRDAPPRRRLSFVEDAPPGQQSAPGGPPAPSRCRPDCPKCHGLVGSYICGSTGDRVWEPIDDDAADSLAEGALTLVGSFAAGLGWFLRGRKEPFSVPEPTDRQMERMSKAARKMAHRRANWIGEYEDLVLGGPTLVSYSKRAFAGSTPEEIKAKREKRRELWDDDDDDEKPKEKPDAAAAE